MTQNNILKENNSVVKKILSVGKVRTVIFTEMLFRTANEFKLV